MAIPDDIASASADELAERFDIGADERIDLQDIADSEGWTIGEAVYRVAWIQRPAGDSRTDNELLAALPGEARAANVEIVFTDRPIGGDDS